jgi:hypothetical protein
MGNFWRGAAEVGNVLYDYQGDKRKWELMDTQNTLQKMKMEALQEDVAGRKAESEALKGISPYDTKITESPEYQGVVSPPDPNEGYSAPPESVGMRQTTTQTPKPIHTIQRDVGTALISRGQAKMGQMYLASAAKEEEAHYNNLATRVEKIAAGNPELANQMLNSDAYADFRGKMGIPQGTNINFQKGELERQIPLEQDFYDKDTGTTYPAGTMVDISWKGAKSPYDSNATITKIKPIGGADKSQTEEQLTRIALYDKNPAKREEAQGILDQMEKRKLGIAREQRAIVVNNPIGGAGATGALTPDAVSQEGAKYLLTGKLPFTGMGGAGRKEMINEAAKIAKEHGWTPNMVLRMQADYKGMDKSVASQRKNYDAMNSFVINMDKQMARLEEIYQKLPRSQYKLLNIPFVALRSKAQGVGEEAQAAALLIELGNESGKLSTNSGASIRELSESAQKQWAKIHDNLLPFTELKKVLDTTRKLGHDRIQSTKDAMDFTLSGIEGLGVTPSPTPTPSPTGTSTWEEMKKKKGW